MTPTSIISHANFSHLMPLDLQTNPGIFATESEVENALYTSEIPTSPSSAVILAGSATRNIRGDCQVASNRGYCLSRSGLQAPLLPILFRSQSRGPSRTSPTYWEQAPCTAKCRKTTPSRLPVSSRKFWMEILPRMLETAPTN